ncbi:hypothetical protein EDB19DRAFT_1672815 [Suillus lakei]|nr:hypothetical protein EDB19DRAFT_1672815 [Suillus lakei]
MRSVLVCVLISRSFYALAKDTSVWLGAWKGREGRPRLRPRAPRQNPTIIPLILMDSGLQSITCLPTHSCEIPSTACLSLLLKTTRIPMYCRCVTPTQKKASTAFPFLRTPNMWRAMVLVGGLRIGIGLRR